jgi:carbamoyl-phosphate synthase large subunit
MMRHGRILITSAGSLVGWTVLTALQPLRSRLTIIGCNTVSASPNMFDCDRAYRVPKTADAQAYLEALRAIVIQERPDLIIPGRDAELAVLSELAADYECRNTCVLAPPQKLVPIFNDKLETARFAGREGLPFAATAYEAGEISALVASHGFPLMIKPRFGGHASKGVRIVTHPEQLQAALAPGGMLVQECLNPETLFGMKGLAPETGIPLHFSILDLRHAAEWLVGSTGEILSLQGVISRTEGPLSMHMRLTDDSSLVAVAGSYARALAKAGHRGVANIQGKRLSDGRFVPFELNGRFTGSAAARAFMGCNQVAHAVCHFIWQESFTDASFFRDTTILRSAIYRAIDQAAIDTLDTKGFWSADGLAVDHRPLSWSRNT